MTDAARTAASEGESLRPLRIGVVGLGWMGQVHARAYLRLAQHYTDLPVRPVLVAVADNAGDARVTEAARRYGFSEVHGDWRDLIARDDIDVVSVTGPNFIHRDVAVAAVQAGKHLWIEKPCGRDAGETREIAAAVSAAGVQSAAGFNYRNAPAAELARELVRGGRLGTVQSVTVRFLADYAADPAGALTWRYQNEWAGSGVLGDLVSHAIDLARHVVGEVEEVVCDTATFITHRAKPAAAAFAHTAKGSGDLLPVENEDHVSALLRLVGGVRGVLEASRVAVGEQCTYGIEVHGSEGALAWDFRRMGELEVCLDQGPSDASWTTRLVRAGDGELAAFQPGSGIAMSYDDLKVIEAHRFVRSIVTGTPEGATVHDAVRAAELVDALQESATHRRWVATPA